MIELEQDFEDSAQNCEDLYDRLVCYVGKIMKIYDPSAECHRAGTLQNVDLYSSGWSYIHLGLSGRIDATLEMSYWVFEDNRWLSIHRGVASSKIAM